MLPKLPVVIERSDICNAIETLSYLAYADEVVYQLKIISRTTQTGYNCRQQTTFGKEAFEKRIGELRLRSIGQESSSLLSGQNTFRFVLKGETTWVIDDLKKSRWIELSVYKRDSTKVDEDRFVSSITFGKDLDGIEIGRGSDKTLGDENIAINAADVKNGAADGAPQIEPIVIITKPTAPYTEKARYQNVQGTVNLKISFLANGGIGEVNPVFGLPFGLTEQAVAAAKKIVFLPKRVNGVPVTTTMSVQYTFSMY